MVRLGLRGLAVLKRMADKNIKVRTVDMHRIGDQIVINGKGGVRIIPAQTVIKNLGNRPLSSLIEDGEVYQLKIA